MARRWRPYEGKLTHETYVHEGSWVTYKVPSNGKCQQIKVINEQHAK